MRLALVVLSLSLYLSPREFRRAYRAAILRDFRDAFEEESALHGPYGSATYAWNACFDVLSTGFRERGAMILRDLVFALRSLRKTPLFAAVVILTLAVAIGANAAVFSVLGGVLFKPLPFADAGRLVAVYQSSHGRDHNPLSYPNFADLRAQVHGLAEVSAFGRDSTTMTGHGKPRALRGFEVSPSFFGTLGRTPRLGRFFVDSDVRSGAARAVVLSDRLWQTLGADSDLLGRTLTFDGAPVTVIGIAPADFRQPELHLGLTQVDYWVAPRAATTGGDSRGNSHFGVIGRLRPDVSVAAASAELDAAMRRLDARYPNDNDRFGISAVPLIDDLLGPVRPLLFGIFAAVAGVLLVACANVANLLLSRAATRERELAVRYAIGASRGRIIAQILTETLVFAVLGGSLGIGLAAAAVRSFVAMQPPGIPRLDTISFDASAALFAFGVVLFCTLAAGLVPALTLANVPLATALKAAGRGADRSRGGHARAVFVVAEIAITLALVTASGLVLRSFLATVATPLAFDPVNVTVVTPTSLPGGPSATSARVSAYQRDVLERVRALPGVSSAGWVWSIPFAGHYSRAGVLIDGLITHTDIPIAIVKGASPDFFAALRIPLERGRLFDENDGLHGPRVAIVNAAFAARYLGPKPLGRRVQPTITGDDNKQWDYTVVGVAADARESYQVPPDPTVYIPEAQFPEPAAALVVRTQTASDLHVQLAAALTAVDPLLDAPVVRPMSTYLEADAARARLSAFALTSLSSIALFLAIAGIYAVVSYGVAQRTHEFGVRLALGARSGDIIRNVVGGSMRLAFAGVACGLVLAAASAQLVRAQLYGVGPVDPLTYGIVVLVVIAVTLLAAYVPALRATRVDPIVALRYE